MMRNGTIPGNGKHTVRLRLKWEPRDLWVGLYWDARKWFGGFYDPVDAGNDAYLHREWHAYLCVLPLLPLHLSVEQCPRPDECRSHRCAVGRWNVAGAAVEHADALLRNREEAR